MSYELILATSIAEQDEINILSTMGPTDREKILSEMLQIETWGKEKDYREPHRKDQRTVRIHRDHRKRYRDRSNQSHGTSVMSLN